MKVIIMEIVTEILGCFRKYWD